MANKNSVRKLPMKLIEKANEKYKETTTIEFHEEDDNVYTITIYPYFDPLKINELIDSLRIDLNEIQKSKIEFPDKLLGDFILYKCVETFTDFPISKSKSIKQRINYFIEVIKTPYFKEVTDMFIQAEYNKVWDKIMEIMTTNEKINELALQAQAEIQNLNIKSPKLREKLQGIDLS